jgi:glycosyltransferase involved in cell wall biosynthesis
MKIIFTFGGLPHYYNYVLNRLNRLPDSTVKVIIPESRGSTLGKGVHESLENIEFGVIRLPEKKSWYGKLYFREFVKTIENEKPDIVVTIWPYILGFVLIPSWRRVRRKVKFKLIYKDIPFNIPSYENALHYYRNRLSTENNNAVHSNWGPLQILYYSILRILFRNFLTSVDAHVYYTEEAYEIIPSYGVEKNKIFITYNSPDTDRLFKFRAELERNSEQILNQPNIILHMGRLVAWKKVDLLIKAFVYVQQVHRQSELWIIGDGPETDNLKNLAENSAAADRIKFIGAVYNPLELGNYMMKAGIYVLAGMGGLSINEAMAYGKPVICSRADGTEKKLVRDGFNGYYFKENDVDDLASKILELMNDPDRIKRFGDHSTGIIKNEININTVIEGYRKAFNFVMNSVPK